jgi:hypothetical protein
MRRSRFLYTFNRRSDLAAKSARVIAGGRRDFTLTVQAIRLFRLCWSNPGFLVVPGQWARGAMPTASCLRFRARIEEDATDAGTLNWLNIIAMYTVFF